MQWFSPREEEEYGRGDGSHRENHTELWPGFCDANMEKRPFTQNTWMK